MSLYLSLYYNIYQLIRRIKEHVDDGNVRVLSVSTSTTTTGEDELGRGDYVDPKIFKRTEKIIMNLPKKSIESQYLAKKLSYSIILITTEAEKYDIPEDKDEKICPEKKCPKIYIAKASPKSKNELQPVENILNQTTASGKNDVVEKILNRNQFFDCAVFSVPGFWFQFLKNRSSLV